MDSPIFTQQAAAAATRLSTTEIFTCGFVSSALVRMAGTRGKKATEDAEEGTTADRRVTRRSIRVANKSVVESEAAVATPKKKAHPPAKKKAVKDTTPPKRESTAINPNEADPDSDSDSAPEDVDFSASRASALESLALQRSLAKALDKKIKEDRQRMHERNLEQKKQKKVKLDEVSNRQETSREPNEGGEKQFTQLKERPSVTRLDRPASGPKLPPGMRVELSSKRLPLAAAVSQAVLDFRNNRLYGEGSGIQRESTDISMARKRKMTALASHK